MANPPILESSLFEIGTCHWLSLRGGPVGESSVVNSSKAISTQDISDIGEMSVRKRAYAVLPGVHHHCQPFLVPSKLIVTGDRVLHTVCERAQDGTPEYGKLKTAEGR